MFGGIGSSKSGIGRLLVGSIWKVGGGFVMYVGSGQGSEVGSERETGLEPATLYLGSRCSTN